jgi:hypothetical protein
MTTLTNYHHFDGLPFATGYLVNTLAYQGAIAPHTGKPYSEALLMGINGGIAAGYFAFEYKGWDPHLHFLTRYPFTDELGAVVERLAIPFENRTTTDAKKALANVVDALTASKPAIVWCDLIMLGYGDEQPPADKFWMVNPVLVYGLDLKAGIVQVADRSRLPREVSVDAFARARARVAKTRHRMATFGVPDESRLPLAVEAGIRSCIDIFAGKPPVGAASSWGFAAYDKWIGLLTNGKGKSSWAKMFAPGSRMWEGLTTTYKYLEVFYTGGSGARHIYADFLDEAAVILSKPAIAGASGIFRESARRWNAFTHAVLPESSPMLNEARELLCREYDLFVNTGAMQSRMERHAIEARLKELKTQASEAFPLNEVEAESLRQEMAQHIRGISAVEREAFAALRAAL